MDSERAVGQTIRDLREQRGMSQAELGRALGDELDRPWPRQTVSQAEAGRRAFPVRELVAVAGVLGVPITDLVAPLDAPGAEATDGRALLADKARAIAAGLRRDADRLEAVYSR